MHAYVHICMHICICVYIYMYTNVITHEDDEGTLVNMINSGQKCK